MPSNTNNKVALVTGGSRGIGRAAALKLGAEGFDVAICGRTVESLDSAATDLRELGVQAWTYQCDVSDVEQIEKMIASLETDAGRVDILVNNAVTSTSAPFDQLTDKEFRYHVDVKLMAYIRIARLVLPFMQRERWGRIVNVGGMTARIVAPFRMTNGVVNAGVANFTKQFAGYAARDNVTVNCVHPGYTVTERIMQVFKKEAAENGTTLETIISKRTADIPLGRLIEPEDLATAIAFFCSEPAGMITGQCLAVDGGSGEAVTY